MEDHPSKLERRGEDQHGLRKGHGPLFSGSGTRCDEQNTFFTLVEQHCRSDILKGTEQTPVTAEANCPTEGPTEKGRKGRKEGREGGRMGRMGEGGRKQGGRERKREEERGRGRKGERREKRDKKGETSGVKGEK